MTVNARNKAAYRTPAPPGDRGLPWCTSCATKPRDGTDREGRLVEHCRCGSQLVTTTGRYVAPPDPPPRGPHPHTQSDHHPWKGGAAANVPSRLGHPPAKRNAL
jgi:hypothetical protein